MPRTWSSGVADLEQPTIGPRAANTEAGMPEVKQNQALPVATEIP
jgi:hypothetical protein